MLEINAVYYLNNYFIDKLINWILINWTSYFCVSTEVRNAKL